MMQMLYLMNVDVDGMQKEKIRVVYTALIFALKCLLSESVVIFITTLIKGH